MKMTKALLFAIGMLFACSLLLSPLPASAACGVTGTMVRMYQYADAYSSSAGRIYIRPYPTANYYFSALTTDDNIMSTAATAITSQTRVYVRGNAATCPTSGEHRYIGNIDYIYINY